MNNSLLRRLARRTTAIGAGAALVAAGLSLGVTVPAHAVVGLTGQLVDAQGNPAEGKVAIYRQQGDSSFTTYSTLTLDNGSFTRTSYPAGVYKFQYSSVDASYTEFFRDKADLASADAVTVADGTTANLGTWTVEQPLVTGTVTDPSGRPVGSAQVTAYNASTQTRVNSDSTDDQGRFYVPVGSAPVKLHVTSYRYNLSDEWYNDKPTFATADAVSGSAAGTNLAIALAPAGKITGQVTNDAGVPLEYVEVWTVSDSSYNDYVDVTDKNGVYVIENVPTGNFDIWFYDPIGEYDDEYYNNVQTRAEATELTVSPGQVVSGINANLTPEAAEVPARRSRSPVPSATTPALRWWASRCMPGAPRTVRPARRSWRRSAPTARVSTASPSSTRSPARTSSRSRPPPPTDTFPVTRTRSACSTPGMAARPTTTGRLS
ncbi:carboxypeptidase-like regulatory domain-containing protein [Nocardioides piscis]|uniref:Alpha-amylase n=1 Tax=Nocardioides piscis TaxID=2714938 RepID=A0A6G7YEY9_9ACTN|nr:carboxypeptidase-like regulatory domain-containing protein [Nocardioides piscis]QIK75208.1 hypothetical protein G7071_06995 [Nocardioides piscis]